MKLSYIHISRTRINAYVSNWAPFDASYRSRHSISASTPWSIKSSSSVELPDIPRSCAAAERTMGRKWTISLFRSSWLPFFKYTESTAFPSSLLICSICINRYLWPRAIFPKACICMLLSISLNDTTVTLG